MVGVVFDYPGSSHIAAFPNVLTMGIASIYGIGQRAIGDARASRENRGVGRCAES